MSDTKLIPPLGTGPWLGLGLHLITLVITIYSNGGNAQRSSDVQYLLQLRKAVINWDEFAAANNIQGWEAGYPECTWTGVTCSDSAIITSVSLECGACKVRATGTLPLELLYISQLTTLNLQGQNFSGPLPSQWFHTDAWPMLENLYLSGNPLGSTLPESQAGAMANLRQLRVSDCQLEGPLPLSWGTFETSMRQLNVLRAANNRLNGTLPEGWGTAAAFPELVTLDLANNSISGSVPALWSDPRAMRFLQELYLRGNRITGSLPPAFGNPQSMQALRYLDLSQNPLGGVLPGEWSQNNSFPNLRSLDLNASMIQGRLPPQWPRSFPQLNSIQLGYNNLTGPIPSEWSNFTQLKLCDDRDLTCLRLPVQLAPACGGDLLPAPEAPPPPPSLAGPTTIPPPTFSTTPSTSSDDSSVGAIVGGVVGGVAAIAALLAIGALVWFRRRRRQRQKASPEMSLQKFEPSQRPFVALEDGLGNGTVGYNGDGSTSESTPKESLAVTSMTPTAAAAGAGGGSGGGGVLDRSHLGPGTILSSMQTSKRQSWLSYEEQRQQQEGGEYGGWSRARGSGDIEGEGGGFYEPELPPFADWEIDLKEIEIMKRPDGSDWELGSGGFGKVYKALRNSVQQVAVKVIPVPLGSNSKTHAASQARKEVALLRACRDTNIVQFQGAHLGPQATLLVTEYLDGGDLMRNLQGGRVNWWKRGRKIALDVAKGLVYLHSKRIIHFDLKSPNILLTRDGTAKIADVGMARFMAGEDVTGAVATLAWAAPEMLWGERCTEKVDIYSYGIVLWEICTGETPIRGQLRDMKVPEECPAEVRELVLECLETRPNKRPSAMQIAERLRELPAALPPEEAQPQPQATQAEREMAKRQWEEVGNNSGDEGDGSPGIQSHP